MDYLSGTYNNRDVEVLYQGNDKPCYLKIVLKIPNTDVEIVRFDEIICNPVVLSAFLRCELLYTDARDFLYDNDVSPTSQLWHLNHEGYPGPRKSN